MGKSPAALQNQIEAQRSGFDLERSRSVASKLSRLRGSERCEACGDDGRKAAELGCGSMPRASYAPSG